MIRHPSVITAAGGSARLAQQGHQTLAPHEINYTDAPPAIEWSTRELPRGRIDFESAEERKLRIATTAIGSRSSPMAPCHWVYLTHHKPTSNGVGATTVMRATWNGSALVEGRDIFESGAVDTEASRIAFDRRGMMYVSISAPGSPQVRRAQDPNDYAGKIVRLRDDGTIPSDNPFVERVGYKPGIFTMGHRNGHGLAANPETGEMWETEQGPSGGDEVNILRPGHNYGWPVVSFGRDYWGPKISRHPFRSGMEDPSVVWLPSIGLTGMTFYTGTRFPHWQRNLFVGGLREGGVPRTGQIQRIVFNDSWQELRREPMLMELGQRIRDVREGPDGLLYALTAEEDGALLRIEPR